MPGSFGIVEGLVTLLSQAVWQKQYFQLIKIVSGECKHPLKVFVWVF